MGGAVAFIVGALLAAIISAVVTYLYLDRGAKSRVRLSQDEANRIVADAEEQKRASAIEAKDQAMRLRSELDRELGNRRKEIDRIERRVEQKEETIDRKSAVDRCSRTESAPPGTADREIEGELGKSNASARRKNSTGSATATSKSWSALPG